MPESEATPESGRDRVQRLINDQRPDLAILELGKLPQPHEPWVLLKLGWAYQNLGDILHSQEHLKKFLQTETNTTPDRAEGIHFLALCDFSEKNWAAARAGFIESEALYTQLNNSVSAGYNHLYLARLDIREGNLHQAQEGIDQSLVLFEQSNSPNIGHLPHILRAQAELEFAKGNIPGCLINIALAFTNSRKIHGFTKTLNFIGRITGLMKKSPK